MRKFSRRIAEIEDIQQQIEDHAADQEDLATKKNKNTSISTVEPKLLDMSNGQELVYNDGSNYWIYRRIGSKLFKSQQTEVT